MGIGFLRIEHKTFLSCVANGTEDPVVGGGLRIYLRGVSCVNCSWLNRRSNNMHGRAIAEIKDDSMDNQKEDDSGEDTDIMDDNIYKLNLENCSFISNYVNIACGAIGLKFITPICTRCVFIHNCAVGGGSAVGGDLKYLHSFTDCVLVGNRIVSCPGYGRGAICVGPDAGGCIGTLSVFKICYFLF
jgi:hypothetical protein